MLTAIVILLVLNILLNLAIGFLNVLALGELGASSKKYRIEFEPVNSPGELIGGADRTLDAARKQSY